MLSVISIPSIYISKVLTTTNDFSERGHVSSYLRNGKLCNPVSNNNTVGIFKFRSNDVPS